MSPNTIRALMLSMLTATAYSHPSVAPRQLPPYSKNTHIFDPPAGWESWKVLYHRAAQLHDGSLISSFETYKPEPPMVVAPVFKSTDLGASYHNFSAVTDDINGWGMRYQPFFYVLPKDFGGFVAGDIVFAGNSIPRDLSQTSIDLYGSRDGALTWEYISTVAKGGRAIVANGETPVWEPFLHLYGDEMIVYFSDQRDPAHGQKLTHTTTRDLRTFTALVDDVADPNYDARPGMTSMVQIGSGDYIMTFEYCGGPAGGCLSHYKVSADPLAFGSANAQLLVANDGSTANGSPYVTWVPRGGPKGTVIANGNSDSFVYLNKDGAAPGSTWTRVDVGTADAYSRMLLPLQDGESLLIAGAGNFVTNPINSVTYSIIPLSDLGI